MNLEIIDIFTTLVLSIHEYGISSLILLSDIFNLSRDFVLLLRLFLDSLYFDDTIINSIILKLHFLRVVVK